MRGGSSKTRELRGEPTDVARELLEDGKHAAVVELVAALTKRNALLEQLVASLRAKHNKSERVSKEQLSLALQQMAEIVAAGGDPESALAEASEQLEKSAAEHGGRVKLRIPFNLGAESAGTWPLVPTHLGAEQSGATGTRSRRSEATLG